MAGVVNSMTNPSVDPFGGTPAPSTKPEEASLASDVPTESKTRKTPGVALGGKLYTSDTIPNSNPFPQWKTPDADDLYVPNEDVDYKDLSDLNRELNRGRARLFRIKQKLDGARREEVVAGDIYRRAYNRQMIGLSGGTEALRKAVAEVNTEDLNAAWVLAQNVVKEYTSLSYNVSRDLDVLKTLCDNLRKEMSMV